MHDEGTRGSTITSSESGEYADIAQVVQRLVEAVEKAHESGAKYSLDNAPIKFEKDNHERKVIHRCNDLSRFIHVHLRHDGTFSISHAASGRLVELYVPVNGPANCNDGYGVGDAMFPKRSFNEWAEEVVAAVSLHSDSEEPIRFNAPNLHRAAKVIVDDGIDGFDIAGQTVGYEVAGQLLAHFIRNRERILLLGGYPNPEGVKELIQLFSRSYCPSQAEKDIAAQAIALV